MNTDGFPYFLFQVNEDGQWNTYSSAQITALNTAAANDEKTINLHFPDPTIKSTVFFEQMVAKYQTDGTERQIRCLILNNESVYAVWSWNESDGPNFGNYNPRMTYFLEVMFQKKAEKVDFYYKAEFEVDLVNLTLKNKMTGILCNIHRVEIEYVDTKWNKKDLKKYVFNITESETLMKSILKFGDDRIKNILFNAPISETEVSSSVSVSLPSDDFVKILEDEVTPKGKLIMADPCFFSFTAREKGTWHVASDKTSAYSATLIRVDINDNTNKYFILQLLKSKNKKNFVIWKRLGVVGSNGHGESSKPFSNLDDAKEKFERIFFEKTRNYWRDRFADYFQREPHYFIYIETFFINTDIEETFDAVLIKILTTVENSVQKLLRIIFTEESNFLLTIKDWLFGSVDTRIGIPTNRQLFLAFEALNEIQELLESGNKGSKLVEACNNFYINMPHGIKQLGSDYYYSKLKFLVSFDDVEEEKLILQTMVYLLNEKASASLKNPMDLYFQHLNSVLTHLDHGCPEFQVLQESVTELHGPTHTHLKLTLLDVFKCHRENEHNSFVDKGNKLLLWHGTPISNFIGILKNGLTVPTVEARGCKLMFGRGLYFADVISKSAQYCRTLSFGLLLLCEVSMGQTIDAIFAGDFSDLHESFGGVKGLGKYSPSSFTNTLLAPEARFPKGPLKRIDPTEDRELEYNEYVVYDVRQVKILYVLKILFSNN